jgi:hypothetical protein
VARSTGFGWRAGFAAAGAAAAVSGASSRAFAFEAFEAAGFAPPARAVLTGAGGFNLGIEAL